MFSLSANRRRGLKRKNNLNKQQQTNTNTTLNENKNDGLRIISSEQKEKKEQNNISLKLDKVKQEDLSFRDYIQKNETQEIKCNKQKRIEEENKYKSWVKSQE
uniref:Uncharacterized protein n=1 Tax=viral metagenome TaxID=1070528 RepID=A0A6C0FBV1_9ZZZZ|tara:strand:- start:37401 stop:37709 length:309 start_codon:yes stop_codon:yes gene_type:complete